MFSRPMFCLCLNNDKLGPVAAIFDGKVEFLLNIVKNADESKSCWLIHIHTQASCLCIGRWGWE